MSAFRVLYVLSRVVRRVPEDFHNGFEVKALGL